MKTNNIKYWDLMAKYFADECTDDEEKGLLEWVEQSAKHKKLFDNIKNDQEIINHNQIMHRVNVDSAWNRLKSRIEADEQLVENKSGILNFNRILKIAAMIIIVVGVGFLATYIYQENFGYYSVSEYTAENEISNEIILPDGTQVFLNENSSLKYPEEFNGTQRKVKLTGEAYFDVTRDEQKPFVIEANHAEIKVLGTSFNVRTNVDDTEVEVYVESGKVEILQKKSTPPSIVVDPGNVGVVSRRELKKLKNEDPNILAWKTKNIIFREDLLGNVFNTLSRVYHVDIQASNDEILNYRLTSTFKNQDIESVIEVICVTFNLKVDYQEEQIYIVKN
ncbi:MAG: FecR domain-containing protein [Bacteroidales bacterium]|jgi:ferric-dicitrate binding protein FerR (iron transport regulator)|nr:FecR domain-containing protein [Bacteroidales bacterium]